MVVFQGEVGLRHCLGCDSPELFDGEINGAGLCFGCAEYGLRTVSEDGASSDDPPRPLGGSPCNVPYWIKSGRHG